MKVSWRIVVGTAHVRTRLWRLPTTLWFWQSLRGRGFPLDIIQSITVVYVELWMFEFPSSLSMRITLERLIRLPNLVKIISGGVRTEFLVRNCCGLDSLVELPDEGCEIGMFEMSR